MRPKILIATGLYPPDIGGSATHVKWLEEKLPPAGFRLNICPFGLVRHQPRILRHLIYVWQLLRRVRQADLIYALDPVSVGVPALIVKWLTGKPLLLRLGGDYAWEQGRQRYGVSCSLDEFITKRTSYGLPVRLLVYLQSRVARASAKVSVQSEQMKRVVTSWGVNPDQIDIITNVVWPIKVTKERSVLRSELKYEGLILNTTARLIPEKGIDTLIKIIPELKSNLGQVTLVVIGDGPIRPGLEELTNQLGVSGQVRFMGRLPRQQMGEMIYASDIFVLNTSYEGMSHQLLEVMGLWVPIITTRIDGNIELITNRQNGLLVSPDDAEAFIKATMELTENSNLKKIITEKASQRINVFSETVIMDRLQNWFKNI